MSATLRDLVVSLSLQTDNFTRNIKSVNKQIQEAESRFKLAAAGVENFESTTTGLATRLDSLQRHLKLQQDAVGQYEHALEAANSKLVESSNREAEYAHRLNTARAAQQALEEQVAAATAQVKNYSKNLGDSHSVTIAARQNLDALKDEYRQSVQKVKKLSGQHEALKESVQNAADAVSTAGTNLNNAQAAVKMTRAAIEQCNRDLKTGQSLWTATGKALESFGKKCESTSKVMNTAGRTLTATMTTPIVALGTAAVKASISYESAFTSVRKTVDATEEEFSQLSDGIKTMSTVVASSADNIAEVVAIAGQLGIGNNYLTSFARTMIDLGNSTDIVAEQAAFTLAKFVNIMRMDQSLFQNLGSTLVDLGNNYATTESAIMEMSLRLAAAGKQVGLSEAQISASPPPCPP